jgi:hypothetical protein
MSLFFSNINRAGDDDHPTTDMLLSQNGNIQLAFW